MKKLIIITTALFLLTAGLKAASLSGQVYNNDTGTGIPSATIQLMNQDSSQTDSLGFLLVTESMTDGYYEFSDLVGGTYSIYVWSYGDLGTFFQDDIEIIEDHIFNIPLATLPGTGTINGQVFTDISGDPLENILLEFMPVYDSIPWNWAFSDYLGNYSVNLPEGQYFVTSFQYGRDLDNPGGDSLYLYQYFEIYDDVQDFELATIVSVTEGETTSGIDFGLPPTPASGNLSHFSDILNGYYLDYINFNSETGLGIINYIVIQSIEAGDIGDEIGILDSYGIPGMGDCDNEEQAEVLVGAGIWLDEALVIPVFGSIDDCGNSGVVYPGFIVGNSIEVVLWDASENTEYTIEAEFSFGSPTPDVGGLPNPAVYGNQYTFANLGGIVTSQVSWSTPDEYVISGNYPNPFNPTTSISYSLPESSDVSIIIYDMKGREVTILVQVSQAAGSYAVTWNGMSAANTQVSTGVYFARINAGQFNDVIKMVYLR